MTFLYETDAVAYARRRRHEQAQWEAAQRRQAAEWGSNPQKVEEAIAQQRAKVLAEVDAAVADTLQEIRRGQQGRALLIVDVGENGPRERTEGAIGRIVDRERATRPAAARPDPRRFVDRSTAELCRLSRESTDLLDLWDVKDVLTRRGELGDEAAGREAHYLGIKVLQVAGSLPSVQERAARDAHLAVVAENLEYALQAIETGGEDAGVRYDAQRRVAAQRAAGDTRPTHLVRAPDGTEIVALEGDAPPTRE